MATEGFPFRVYADESGIHDSAAWCIVGGYFGRENVWQGFQRTWNDVLTKYNLPEFHSKPFYSGDPPYKDPSTWPGERRTQLLEELIATIAAADLQPVGTLVDVKGFFSFTYGERRWLTTGLFDTATNQLITSGAPDTPYFLAFSNCLTEAALKAGYLGEKILFIFDEQNLMEGHARQTFKEVVQLNRPETEFLGDIDFRRRESHAGLQAADLLVSTWYRKLTRNDPIQTREQKVLDAFAAKSVGLVNYSKAQMEQTLETVGFRGALQKLEPPA